MRRSIWFLCLLTVGACIDPFAYNTISEPLLVIDGMITNLPGPDTIKLSYTNQINDQIFNVHWATGAQVTIRDDVGNNDKLTEVSAGHFVTNLIRGVVGRTYTLSVRTAEDVAYESTPEKLEPVGAIRNLYFEFVQKEPNVISLFDTTSYGRSTSNGFNVYVDSDVVPEQQGRTRWIVTSVYEVHSRPYLEPKYANPCKGFSDESCTCCYCWVKRSQLQPNLQTVGKGINRSIRTHLLFQPALVRIFYDHLQIKVQQISISEKSYTFWSKVEQGMQSGQSLFQTPAPFTVGNISGTTEGAPRIIGIFSAAAVETKTLNITKEDLPYQIVEEIITRACHLIEFPNSHETKPPDY